MKNKTKIVDVLRSITGIFFIFIGLCEVISKSLIAGVFMMLAGTYIL